MEYKSDPAKFIVCNEKYAQNACYAAWLASVLDRLYANPPKTAKALVENAARYMQPDSDSHIYEFLKRTALQRMGIPDEGGNKKIDAVLFGPILDVGYGVIDPEHQALYTPASERDYINTIARIYPDEISSQSAYQKDFKLKEFFYPIPRTDSKLELMKLGQFRHLDPRYKMDTEINFKHATLGDKYNDLMICLEDLFKRISDNESNKSQKEDAVIAFFWLMAQTTPAMRGGTAHAKLTLEYLASEINMEIPHTKPGYDLWAEAASTSLELFTARFKAGAFFDKSITSEQILDWQRQQLTAQNLGPSRNV